MKHLAVLGMTVMLTFAATPPAWARGGEQFGSIGKAVKKANQLRELQMTDEEEQKLGAEVSNVIRERYGVVQDPAVHRYVTLVGAVLAVGTGRPNLPWTFIVLDTDGVNAFAAPGGYVHITKGALALVQNEAELAGVLGHEITHVTEQHTIRAVQKKGAIKMGAEESLSGNAALFNQVVGEVVSNITNQAFSAGEENESDEKGVGLAGKVGYSPQALADFLTRLKDRNKESQEKRGLFPSHPEMQSRIDKIGQQASAMKPAGSATLAERYRKFIRFEPVPQAEIAMVEAGSAGLAGGSGDKPDEKKQEPKKEEPKKRGFGLGKLVSPGGGEKQSTQASASGGSRGLDPERDGKGGPNPKPVPVKVDMTDINAFKKEGGLT
ncbi:MAG: M48 family metalloprotease [Vicinamibacterales bacterium]